MALTVGAAALSAHWASATAYSWNTSIGKWELAADWGPSTGFPGSADTAAVNNGGVVQLGFGTTSSYAANIIGAGNVSAGIGTFVEQNLSGGTGTTLAVGSGGTLLGTVAGTTGVFQLNSGVFTDSGAFTLGSVGTGYFNVGTGGVAVLTNGTNTNLTVGSAAGGVGTINVMGGAFNTSATGINVGLAGTGTLNISGGAFTDPFKLSLGNSAGGVGSVLLSGGLLNMTATASNFLYVGVAGTGSIVQTGGTLNTSSSVLVDVGNASGGSGAISVANAGTAFNANGGLYVSDGSGSKGTLTLSGGTITTTNLFAGRQGTASGVINQSGGAMVANGTPALGGNSSSDSLAVGTYTLTAGTFTTTGAFAIGSYGTGGLFQSGGTAGDTNAAVSIGQQTSGYGVLDVAGGTFSDSSSGSRLLVGENGSGVLNVRNAVVNVSGYGTASFGTAVAGGAALDLAKNGGATGIVNLGAGGVINAPNVGSSSTGTGTSIFNFHGGSLQTTANTSSSTAPFLSGLTSAYVYAEGAVFNTAAGSGLVTQPLLTPAGSGLSSIPASAFTGGAGYQSAPVVRITGGTGAGATAVANVVGGVVTGFTITNPGSGYAPGDQLTVALVGGLPTTAAAVTAGGATLAANTAGSLTKNGANALTLTPTASNTYTGGTIVNGGTLVTGNNLALPAGSALANNGAAVNFDGSYLSAPLTNPADPTTATAPVTLGTLASGGGSLFSFNVSSASADYLAFSGAANVSAGSVIGLNFPVGTSLTAGTYDLLSASLAGSTLGNFSLSQSSVSTGGETYPLSLQTATTATTQYEELVIGGGQVAKLYFANGAGGSLNAAGNYTVDQPGTNASSATPTSNTDLFFTAATAAGSTLTATQDGLAVVNSLEFNSSGSITVAPGTATGPLTISAGANTFAAGTGIVVDAGAGAATVSANLALARAESFLNNSTNPLTLAGSISGTGTTLTYAGTGAGGFTVSGANAYTGGTVVAVPAGTAVTLANNAALGSAGNAVAVASGTLALNGLAVTQSALNLAGGSVSGAGTLTLTSPGAAVQIPVGTTYGSASPALSSTLALTGLTTSVVKAAGGATGGNPVLSGNIALGGNATVVVADTSGDAAPELALTGVISGAGSLSVANNAPPAGVTVANASDAGTLFLGGSNTYSGGTNINYGRLVVASNNALGTGAVTINIGTGNASGGTLQLGNANYTATTSPLGVASTVNGLAIPNAITFGGAVSGTYSAGIINAVGNNALTGPITLANANQVASVAAGTILTLNGTVGSAAGTTGTFLTTASTGTLLLAGSNTYVGGTSVATGSTVRVGNAAALGATGNAVVVNGTNTSRGVLDLNGMAVTQATLNFSGGQLGDSVGGGVLTLNNPRGPAILVPVGQGYGPFNSAAGVGNISLTGTTNYVVRAAGGASNGPVLTGGLALSGTSVFALADSSGDTVPEMTVTGVVSGPGALALADNNTASGVTPLNTSDAGTLLLTNSNTYSGGSNISYGRIVIANGAALGTGAVTIGGTANASGGTLQLGNANYNSGNSTLAIANNFTALTVANNINLAGATNGNYSAGIINNVGANTLSGNLSLTAAAETINVSGGSLALAGPIGSTGAAALTLTASSANNQASPAYVVSGNNAYAGSTIVTGTTAVRLGSGTALGAAANQLTVAGSSVTAFGVVDVNGQSITQGSLNMTGGRIVDATGTGTVTLGAAGGMGLAINIAPPSATYTAAVTAPAIGGVSLILPSGGYIAKSTTLGFPIIGSPINVANGTATFVLADTSGDGAAELGITGSISGGGSVTLANNAAVPGVTIPGSTADAATLGLGSNSYTGGTTIGYGRIVINNSSSLGTGTVTIGGGVGTTGGTLQIGDTNYAAASGPVVYVASAVTGLNVPNVILLGGATTGTYAAGLINNTGANTLSGPITITQANANVVVATNTALTLSGPITSAAGVTGGLTANAGSSAGVLTLSGNNTYAGPTTIQAGTLVANGPRVVSGGTLVSSSTGLGTVTVAASNTATGILAGTGGTGDVVVNGIISAGTGATTADTPGTLYTGNQTWNGGGTYVAKVASPSSNDELVMSGLTIAATSGTSPFSVNAASGSTVTLNAGSQVVIALDTNTAQAGVYQNAINAGLLVLTAGTQVTFSDGSAVGLGEVDVASGEELVLMSAPEPTSLLLVAAAVGPLALGRRRRRSARR